MIVFPLGEETLADRLTRRLSRATAMDYAVQMISAVAYAHDQKVLHRDIKPENFILFPDQVIQLTDFGLARIERGGHEVSGSGTLGFIAPEQAMGKPTFRSDVFSLGLVIYRMFAGEVPEYPFDSLPGFNRFRKGMARDFVAIIQESHRPHAQPSFSRRGGHAQRGQQNSFPADRSVRLTAWGNDPHGHDSACCLAGDPCKIDGIPAIRLSDKVNHASSQCGRQRPHARPSLALLK